MNNRGLELATMHSRLRGRAPRSESFCDRAARVSAIRDAGDAFLHISQVIFLRIPLALRRDCLYMTQYQQIPHPHPHPPHQHPFQINEKAGEKGMKKGTHCKTSSPLSSIYHLSLPTPLAAASGSSTRPSLVSVELLNKLTYGKRNTVLVGY